MRIIERIEINYFRSLYSLNLSSANDINVFVGGNDVGKSNILKALNLFFNNAPDLEAEFDFLRDLSRLREHEARSAKGRATVWIRVTFNNFLHWRSLPPRFAIKRSWNRYSNQPSDTPPREIAGTTIGRFLNRIAFHYVPAVRSRDLFSHYLRMLHDALIDDEGAGIREASNALMNSINQSTQGMSDDIATGLGFKSTIKVPEDLRQLFAALDFATDFNNYSVPLQLRGDGIQARHIPFILDFIGHRSRKTHIWAYEEPENSLEMGKAFELARQFDRDFRVDNQIFITTHSPAFYDLSGPHVTKWHVRSDPIGPGQSYVTTADMITATHIADYSLGVAALVAARAREVHEQNDQLMKTVSELDGKLKMANRTQVIVEGASDQRILERALELLFPGDDVFCDFVPVNGVTNITAYIESITRLGKERPTKVIGLLDNDHAGRKAIGRFKKYKYAAGTAFRELSKTLGVYVGVLQVPGEFKELVPIFEKHSAPQDEVGIPMPIEFSFSKETVQEAIAANVLRLSDRFTSARHGELALSVNLSSEFSKQLSPDVAYLAKKIDEDSKMPFAEWVTDKDADVFRNLQPTLVQIRDITKAN